MNNVLMISQNKIGSGSDELGKLLLKSFIATLVDNNNYDSIVLLNSGVKIVCDENLLDDLSLICKKSKILICQTCLNYYELENKVLIGNKSNMIEITNCLNSAKKVVNI